MCVAGLRERKRENKVKGEVEVRARP